MCGYCTEETALNILTEDIRGNLQMKDLGNSLSRYFYLRETQDFISSLDRLRRSLAYKMTAISSDVPPFLAQKKPSFFSEVPPEVVLYRGLEILLEQGFSSPAYQQLLKKQLYRDSIAATCSNEKRAAFELATEGLNIEHLSMLYDAETYFWRERSLQLRTLSRVLPSCRNLLKDYVAWWLNGEGLQITDEGSIPDQDIARFHLLLRAIYFSILMVGSCSAGKKMLLAIVNKFPAATPLMQGDDLWLQRVAALKLYNMEGFELFIKHLTTISHSHYFYIDQIRLFSKKQKQLLLDEVNRHLEVDSTNSFLCRMRTWLMDPSGRYVGY
jgi:hypothetical protein